MATTHAAAAGLHGATQEADRAGVVIAFGFQRLHAGLGFIREEFRHDRSFIIHDALRGAEPNHFFRLQLDRQLRGDLF